MSGEKPKLNAQKLNCYGTLGDIVKSGDEFLERLSQLPKKLYYSESEKRYLREEELVINDCAALRPDVDLVGPVQFLPPENSQVSNVIVRGDWIEIQFELEKNNYFCLIPKYREK